MERPQKIGLLLGAAWILGVVVLVVFTHNLVGLPLIGGAVLVTLPFRRR